MHIVCDNPGLRCEWRCSNKEAQKRLARRHSRNALCVNLGISERVRDALPETTSTRETETNTKIGALFKTGLGDLKHCRNEQQRIQCLVGLSLVMPQRMEKGDSKGGIRRITAAASGGRRRYGAHQGMGPKRFVLSADNNNEFRSRCE